MNRILLVVLVGLIVFQACRKDSTEHDPTPYVLEIPSHFPDMPIPADNPMTEEGVALGRRLFYEKMLSGDNTISCGTCHSPENAFSDPNQFSTGIDGIQGTRNSMALMNLGWQTSFFWDGRAHTLEEQILQPVPNPIEMHQTWVKAVAKLKNDISYKNMFYEAFGESDFDSTHVSKAVAQFLRTMISGNSKFDLIYKYTNGIQFTAQEQIAWQSVTNEERAGYDLFLSMNDADCLHCHIGPLMQVDKFSNNGLDLTFTDLGRGAITGNVNDNGKFKVPSLRNIELSAPYMHDGRFQTLDDVIEHYSTGVVQSPTIDPLMQFVSEHGVQLDEQERQLLKAFLLTLTDEEFVTNPDFRPLNP